MTNESEVSTSTAPEPELTPTEEDAPAPEAEVTAIPMNTVTDISAIRELVLRAHPDVVPEMVNGETVDDLLASIEPAEAAYRRVSEALRVSTSSPATPTVPAGGDRPMPVDPDRLPASEKIRRGLAHR